MKKHTEQDEVFPELTTEIDGKKVRSVDYGWEDDTFVVVDKDTGVAYRFAKAYISKWNMGGVDGDTIVTSEIL